MKNWYKDTALCYTTYFLCPLFSQYKQSLNAVYKFLLYLPPKQQKHNKQTSFVAFCQMLSFYVDILFKLKPTHSTTNHQEKHPQKKTALIE